MTNNASSASRRVIFLNESERYKNERRKKATGVHQTSAWMVYCFLMKIMCPRSVLRERHQFPEREKSDLVGPIRRLQRQSPLTTHTQHTLRSRCRYERGQWASVEWSLWTPLPALSFYARRNRRHNLQAWLPQWQWSKAAESLGERRLVLFILSASCKRASPSLSLSHTLVSLSAMMCHPKRSLHRHNNACGRRNPLAGPVTLHYCSHIIGHCWGVTQTDLVCCGIVLCAK